MMLDLPRPTPTCTRFQATTEINCIKCNDRMKLVLIEPRGGKFNLLTYRCSGCSASESFLNAI
jgi:DNA-directed RNA polymerase subunit RPC12/RpoP